MTSRLEGGTVVLSYRTRDWIGADAVNAVLRGAANGVLSGTIQGIRHSSHLSRGITH